MPTPTLTAVARTAQRSWQSRSVRERLEIIKRLRHRIASCADELADAIDYPARNGRSESLASEVIPILDACRFLELHAESLLRPDHPSNKARPDWLRGVRLTLIREPLGVVLILGAANYPLFLVGVQTLQALVAGNAVLLKPAPGATPVVKLFKSWLVESGLHTDLLQLLDTAPISAAAAIAEGVDKVVLTGSAQTGRAVLSTLTESLTPATMELSGCDAVFVLPSCDMQRAAKALAFGLTLNTGATCIGPRRVFVPAAQADQLIQATIECVRSRMTSVECKTIVATSDQVKIVADALASDTTCLMGGVESGQLTGPTILRTTNVNHALLQSDVSAPVMTFVPVDSTEDAIEKNGACPYALGATIFGDGNEARMVAEQVDAGCVVINDMIAPTADPRIPFGGRGESGFGVTRGAAGLAEMTRIKAIVEQKSRWLPHLDPTSPHDADLLSGFAQFTHGETIRIRLAGLRRLISAAMQQRKWARETPTGEKLHSDSKQRTDKAENE